MCNTSRYREFTLEKQDDFLKRGYKQRHFFPHRIYYVPKCGPDGVKQAYRMCGESDPNKQWEVLLYASSPLIDEFPEELFFDDDLIWHQQQFGKIGQIAYACLVVKGGSLCGFGYVSDLVQRISRRKDYKTRIVKNFRGWPYMLFNSIMNFAIENNIKTIYSPTSDFAMENTDPKRHVQRELFERAYDRAVYKHFLAIKEGKWWVIDVSNNRDRIIIPEKKREIIENGKTICLCHDIERGLGHIDVDPKFAELVNKTSHNSLEEMLRIEKGMNVKATYNIVGCILNDVREKIEIDGHCIAFHSFDHSSAGGQLYRCKDLDSRIKGYRTPRSELTPELTDEKLCFNNFEWLASSAYSFGFNEPIMENRIVKIPILFDDYDLYKKNISFEVWEEKAISQIKENDFVAFGLHDCYGEFWLPHYKEFLKKIKGSGVIKTMNEVSTETILCYAL